MGRILTLRGVLSSQEFDRIMMFDSSVNKTGWKILDFKMMNQTNGQYLTLGILTTNPDFNNAFPDWDPNQTIGIFKSSPENNYDLLLDYNHVIVNSLYLLNADNANAACYMVVLEEIPVTADENIIYQLKEIAQSVN